MQIYLILSLLIAIVSVVFAMQNPAVVVLKFINWQFAGSVALVLLLAFAAGFIAGILITAPANFRRRLALSSHKKKIGQLEAELKTKGPGGGGSSEV